MELVGQSKAAQTGSECRTCVVLLLGTNRQVFTQVKARLEFAGKGGRRAAAVTVISFSIMWLWDAEDGMVVVWYFLAFRADS